MSGQQQEERMHVTMMKIRAVMTFATAQVVLAREHTSGRPADAAHAADRAIRCNRSIDTRRLSNRASKPVPDARAEIVQ